MKLSEYTLMSISCIFISSKTFQHNFPTSEKFNIDSFQLTIGLDVLSKFNCKIAQTYTKLIHVLAIIKQ